MDKQAEEKQEKPEIDINLDDEDVVQAAIKIQGHYKKKMKMMENKKYGVRNQ